MWHHFSMGHETQTDIQELGFTCPRQWEMGIGKGREKCWFLLAGAKGWVQICFFGPWWWLPDLKDKAFPFQEVIDAGQSCWKKRIVLVVEAWPCQEGTARERAAPGTNCPRKDRDEVLIIRHCPCSWAAQRISVTDYKFLMVWVWNAFMAVQHSKGCTRNCQLGKLCGQEADLREESSRQENRCDGNTCSHLQSLIQ